MASVVRADGRRPENKNWAVGRRPEMVLGRAAGSK